MHREKQFFSRACSIELEERVILTGGIYTKNTVSVYSLSGWIKDLPELLQRRYHHGCGHYVNDVNKMVIFLIHKRIDMSHPLPGIFGNRGLHGL